MIAIIITPLDTAASYLDSLSLNLSQNSAQGAITVHRSMPGTKYDDFMMGTLRGTYRNTSGQVLLMGPQRPTKKQLCALYQHYGTDAETQIIVVAPSHYAHNLTNMRDCDYWSDRPGGTRPLVLEAGNPAEMAEVLRQFSFSPNRAVSADLCADPYRAQLEANPSQINKVLAALWREGAHRFV